jgi:hypothetical protein
MRLSKQDLDELEAAGAISIPREVGNRSTIYQVNDPEALKAWTNEHEKATDGNATVAD